jgi:cytochrome c553
VSAIGERIKALGAAQQEYQHALEAYERGECDLPVLKASADSVSQAQFKLKAAHLEAKQGQVKVNP